MASFLSLPLEVRMEIYAYLLTLPSPKKTMRKPPTRRRPGQTDASAASSSSYYAAAAYGDAELHPAVLHVSRQVHAEASAVLYRANIFAAHHSLLAALPRLRAWFPPVHAPAPLALIRRFWVRVRLDCDPPWTAAAVAAAFAGARELVIEACQPVFMGSGPEALRSFEAVRGVCAARVVGSTDGFEAYARWLEGVMRSPIGSVIEKEWEKEDDVPAPCPVPAAVGGVLKERGDPGGEDDPLGFGVISSFSTPPC